MPYFWFNVEYTNYYYSKANLQENVHNKQLQCIKNYYFKAHCSSPWLFSLVMYLYKVHINCEVYKNGDIKYIIYKAFIDLESGTYTTTTLA